MRTSPSFTREARHGQGRCRDEVCSAVCVDARQTLGIAELLLRHARPDCAARIRSRFAAIGIQGELENRCGIAIVDEDEPVRCDLDDSGCIEYHAVVALAERLGLDP